MSLAPAVLVKNLNSVTGEPLNLLKLMDALK